MTDQNYIKIALYFSNFSTCLRNKVGAILVKEGRIISTGFNGAPSKLKHCIEVGCLRQRLGIDSGERSEICRGAHAELNAISFAAFQGISVKNSKLYCSHSPCSFCMKQLINAGLKEIIYKYRYNDQLAFEIAEECGIVLRQIEIEDEDNSF